MKLVQLIPELNEGGVERGTVELSRELVKKGIQNTVISAGGRLVKTLESQGSQHITIDIKSKNLLSFYFRMLQLRSQLKQLSPDIIHARSRVPAWLAYFANKTLKIPFVTTVHGYNSINAYSKIMTAGDRVICGSNFMIDHIKQHYHTNPDKIVLIPRGIDDNSFSQALDKAFIQEFKKQYDLDNHFIVTVVGRITAWKGQKTIIESLVRVLITIPETKLLIIGSPQGKSQHYFQELKTLIEQLKLNDKVVFTGNQQKIKEIFSLSNLSISSSNKPETFGRANIESLFMNTPLIATNIGATQDYVLEGKNGFFFEPDNADQLAELIIKSRDYCFDKKSMEIFIKQNFNLSSMVDKKIRLYQELISAS